MTKVIIAITLVALVCGSQSCGNNVSIDAWIDKNWQEIEQSLYAQAGDFKIELVVIRPKKRIYVILSTEELDLHRDKFIKAKQMIIREIDARSAPGGYVFKVALSGR